MQEEKKFLFEEGCGNIMDRREFLNTAAALGDFCAVGSFQKRKTVIFGGNVCDGSGAEPSALDLLLEGERIADIGAPGSFDAVPAERISAKGLTVVPGFIDAHSHDDGSKILFPKMRTKLLQGVTTTVDGNCGNSPCCDRQSLAGKEWRGLAEYATLLKREPASVNTVSLCGHNTIRRMVMGNSSAKPSAAELKEMQALLAQAFEAGAAGWTTGLTYFPGKFADTEELLALSAVTKGSRRVYATHIRSEGDELIPAVKEAIAIGKAGSSEVEISHLKTIFPRNYHKIGALMDALESAREEMILHADRYPYVYSSTRIGQILPPPFDRDVAVAEKLRSSEAFQQEVETALRSSPRDLASTILCRSGRSIAAIAEGKGCSLEHAAMEILMESPEQKAGFLCMSEENMRTILAKPWVCAGSDGLAMLLDDPGNTGHPRSVGTFPRFFRIVSKLCGAGEAVRRMTSLPATIFHIPERGMIRKGYYADLVLLDLEWYDSTADFSDTDPMPKGVARVLVNGRTAWDENAPERIGRHGRFLAIS